MKRYILGKNGIYTGREIDISKYDTYPSRSTDIKPPSLKEGEYAQFDGEVWQIITELPPVKVPVPASLDKRQFRRALDQFGLLDTVNSEVKKAPISHQIDFEYSDTFERDLIREIVNGAFDAMTDSEIDQLFIEGASL